MRTKKVTWLLLMGVLGAFFAACAPVTPPPEDKTDKTDEEAPTPVLHLPEVLHTPRDDKVTPAQARVRAAIDAVRRRELLMTHGFWTVFHGILGLGPSLQLRNDMTGERVNAMDYIFAGGEMRGLGFLPTKYGLDVPSAKDGIGVGQGHQDQFVAEMGQWGMPADRKVIVLGKEYTFMDFVRESQMRASVNPKRNQELSWAVIVVGQYVGTDVTWTNMFGEKLHYEDMIRYELDQSVENAACGGTHRLFGLTWSYYLHLNRGGKAEGVWKEVVEKIAKYRDNAKEHQNPDGSLSTDFFKGPGNSQDKSLRINTTGHMLEWLALALTDEEIKEQWVEDAAVALSQMILDVEGSPVAGGTLYHAVHGLLMYHARVYGTEWLGLNNPVIPLPRSLQAKTGP